MVFILAGLVLGAVVGSFMGVVLIRLPDGRPLVMARSACDTCDKELEPFELVPILSWAVQGGKCRECGSAIDCWQLAAELGGAAIGALAVMLGTFPVWAMLLGWQLLLLAMLDLRHMWLPRQLSALLGASGALFALVMGYWADDMMGIALSLVGGAFGFAALWMLGQGYQMWRGQEGLGGGDPPLLGAIGLWLGPLGVIHTLLAASLLGLAVAFVLWRAGQKITSDTMLPLGTLLAVAAWPVFLWQGF
ncbi:A24 family peptidase [Novosphingobium sp.]|uniref:prepilin peptidase n=1 Tax=Novosphingobium sp. TaxID=1874826 RepID=UPI0026206863|nr:A24 family peptidase [Novosphingobium sp.]